MERTGKSPECRRDCAVHIRQGSSDHTRSERGRVQFVIGLQNQRDIEHMRVKLIGHFAFEHIKKIGGDIEIRIWLDWIEIVSRSIDRGNDSWKSRGKPSRDSNTCFARKIASFLIEKRE